ncbi:MAG: polymer-forming cytoskeletal protein [Pseudomonadales bacterium]
MSNVSPLQQLAPAHAVQLAPIAQPAAPIREPDTPGYRIEGMQLVIDHRAEDVRHVLQAHCAIQGTIEILEGGLFLAGNVATGRINIPNGALIVAEGAEIGAEVSVKRLFNLGTIKVSTVTATELLVNWGAIEAEEVATVSLRNGGKLMAKAIRYGDMESIGVMQGNLARVS